MYSHRRAPTQPRPLHHAHTHAHAHAHAHPRKHMLPLAWTSTFAASPPACLPAARVPNVDWTEKWIYYEPQRNNWQWAYQYLAGGLISFTAVSAPASSGDHRRFCCFSAADKDALVRGSTDSPIPAWQRRLGFGPHHALGVPEPARSSRRVCCCRGWHGSIGEHRLGPLSVQWVGGHG